MDVHDALGPAQTQGPSTIRRLLKRSDEVGTRFRDAEDEAAFREEWRQSARSPRAVGFAVALLLFVGSAALDRWLAPESWRALWWLKGLSLPVFGFVLVAVLHPRLERYATLAAAIGTVVGGAVLVAACFIVAPAEVARTLNPAPLFILFIWVYSVAHFHLPTALGLGGAVVIGFGIGAVLEGILAPGRVDEGGTHALLFQCMYLAAANVLGIMAGWLLERNARREFIERRSLDRLVANLLPERVVERLHHGEGVIWDRHESVTVLFADLVGFTPLADRLSPERLVGLLDGIFGRFDGIVSRYGLEKIKTIGDAYLAVAGIDGGPDSHAEQAALVALAMRGSLVELRQRHGVSLSLRVGLHTGPVIGGVIGRQRVLYDIWGDTVNTASRMESHAEVGQIQVSAETEALLRRRFRLESRGRIPIKGKGELETWWVSGVRSESRTGRRSTDEWATEVAPMPAKTVQRGASGDCVPPTRSMRPRKRG